MTNAKEKKSGFLSKLRYRASRKNGGVLKNKTAEKDTDKASNIATRPPIPVESELQDTNEAAAKIDEPKDLALEGGKKQSTESHTSWLTRSKNFRRMSDWAFEAVDVDGSGCVDEKELYSGLLLIHLKLGTYAGPAACKPVDRERVHDIFVKRDADGSGSLDKLEFREVMSVLCGNVLTRVVVQWSLTLMIVPLVAQVLLDGFVWGFAFVWDQIMEIDQIDNLEDTVACQIHAYSDRILEHVPDFVIQIGTRFKVVLDMIPDSVWDSIPVTLISCVLGCLVVPYIIFKIDDFFQSLAENKKQK
eukprot:CAMPEP_0194200360 /NCGR_PEP_ID=MMETSP0156-20130528/994_1 /TAXON_ID=33649 /ORGANISM="Thalassionema nitzschioides, Strain L26-B" /LENGTH=302 /DNA_ID=CAMNT_0038925341 /DNA_START=80 /DNA_END=988 /DNA_ORIENTATION=+